MRHGHGSKCVSAKAQAAALRTAQVGLPCAPTSSFAMALQMVASASQAMDRAAVSLPRSIRGSAHAPTHAQRIKSSRTRCTSAPSDNVAKARGLGRVSQQWAALSLCRAPPLRPIGMHALHGPGVVDGNHHLVLPFAGLGAPKPNLVLAELAGDVRDDLQPRKAGTRTNSIFPHSPG
jgi:hypothetical protein